jgi:hypothetical protein
VRVELLPYDLIFQVSIDFYFRVTQSQWPSKNPTVH